MKFVCDHCGECCRQLIIEIDELDVAREPRLAEVAEPFKPPTGCEIVFDDEDEQEEYERVGPLAPGFEHGALLACGATKPCSLLGPDNLCTIYPTRPNCCVACPAGGNLCQQARGMAGLTPLEPTEIEVTA